MTYDAIPVDGGRAVPSWAPHRSSDGNFAWGKITAQTRVVTAEAMGCCSDVVQEVEAKMNTILQCPTKVREGKKNDNSIMLYYVPKLV